MTIAIPVSANRIDSSIDERFARCPYFCFFNTITKETEFKENSHKDGSSGIGPQVAEFLANNGVNEVFVKEVGPKAQKILDKLNISIKLVSTGQTVQQIIRMLTN